MATTKDFVAPIPVQENAKKGLELRKKFGRGSTKVGIYRGHQLAEGQSLSLDIIKRMSSYFARHEIDKKADDFGNEDHPSNGYIAWLLWGGDAGKKWADDLKEEYAKN